MTSSVEPGRKIGNPAEEVRSYPNPFNQRTTIRYQLPEDSYVTITICNLQGQIVTKLVNNLYQEAGPHTVAWNASGFAI